MKFNNICPACGNDIFHKRNLRIWGCQKCYTQIHTRGEDGAQEVNCYFIKTKFNQIEYWACFYYQDPNDHFVLQFKDTDTHYKKILRLEFHPNINAHNFNDKLKTILTFY